MNLCPDVCEHWQSFEVCIHEVYSYVQSRAYIFFGEIFIQYIEYMAKPWHINEVQ